jgi:hypothetical protein
MGQEYPMLKNYEILHFNNKNQAYGVIKYLIICYTVRHVSNIKSVLIIPFN